MNLLARNCEDEQVSKVAWRKRKTTLHQQAMWPKGRHCGRKSREKVGNSVTGRFQLQNRFVLRRADCCCCERTDAHMAFNDSGKMTTSITLNLPGGSTAMDALYALKTTNGIDVAGTGSVTGSDGTARVTYVSAIDGLGEKMCGNMSGWCYVSTKPGKTYTMPMVGAASYALTEGEHITWVYTCNYSDISQAMK